MEMDVYLIQNHVQVIKEHNYNVINLKVMIQFYNKHKIVGQLIHLI